MPLKTIENNKSLFRPGVCQSDLLPSSRSWSRGSKHLGEGLEGNSISNMKKENNKQHGFLTKRRGFPKDLKDQQVKHFGQPLLGRPASALAVALAQGPGPLRSPRRAEAKSPCTWQTGMGGGKRITSWRLKTSFWCSEVLFCSIY